MRTARRRSAAGNAQLGTVILTLILLVVVIMRARSCAQAGNSAGATAPPPVSTATYIPPENTQILETTIDITRLPMYFIQLASLDSEDKARATMAELGAMGISSVTYNDAGSYKVLCAMGLNRDDLLLRASEISAAKGIETYVKEYCRPALKFTLRANAAATEAIEFAITLYDALPQRLEALVQNQGVGKDALQNDIKRAVEDIEALPQEAVPAMAVDIAAQLRNCSAVLNATTALEMTALEQCLALYRFCVELS